MGIERFSFLKKILLAAVSMTAPSDLNTLLAIRNGVLDGTTTTLIHCEPIGKKMAFRPVTVLSLPNLKLTWQDASRIRVFKLEGKAEQSSENCFAPITDMLAPRSTIPHDP